jgi:predicted nucleic acid-binding protein
MITYVDTSTLLKLVVAEDGSDRAAEVWAAADSLVSVNLITVEARAALAAAHRGGRLTTSQYRQAKDGLASLLGDLHLIAVTDELLQHAADLAEAEALRGYDAVHLAAALSAQAAVVTSADSSLCDAALRRGLHVANPLVR